MSRYAIFYSIQDPGVGGKLVSYADTLKEARTLARKDAKEKGREIHHYAWRKVGWLFQKERVQWLERGLQ
jgi:hypothetical protein